MKYIKTYEKLTDGVTARYKEIFDPTPKLTSEEKELMSKVRYTMNKFWGGNCCGVTKNRDKNHSDYRFSIYVPNYLQKDKIKNWELKMKYWIKFMNEIGTIKQYDHYDYDYLLNEEQMKEIVSRTKYIDTIIDAEKYNL